LHAAGLALVGDLNDAALEDCLSVRWPTSLTTCRFTALSAAPGARLESKTRWYSVIQTRSTDAASSPSLNSRIVLLQRSRRTGAHLRSLYSADRPAPAPPRIRFADELRSLAFTSESVDGERNSQ
jgi:hypothetical protein